MSRHCYGIARLFVVACLLVSHAAFAADEEAEKKPKKDHEMRPEEPIYYWDENHISRVPFDSIDDNLSAEQATEQRYDQRRSLPFFRKKAIEKGIFLPWPYGLSLVNIRFTEPLQLDSLKISGLPEGVVLPIDPSALKQFIDPNDLQVVNYSLRFDMWLFPFLNVYAIAGKTQADLALQLNNPLSGATLERTFSQRQNSFGGGATLAAGWGQYFLMLDTRYTQTDVNLSTDGAKTTSYIFRTGWNGKIGRVAGAAWVGALRQDLRLRIEASARDFALAPPLFQNTEVELKIKSPNAWTPVVGTRWDITAHWDIAGEYSWGEERHYFSASLGYRF